MRKKAVKNEQFELEFSNVANPKMLRLVRGARPYLWIGSAEGPCFGVVPDKQVKKLAEWCREILETANDSNKQG